MYGILLHLVYLILVVMYIATIHAYINKIPDIKKAKEELDNATRDIGLTPSPTSIWDYRPFLPILMSLVFIFTTINYLREVIN